MKNMIGRAARWLDERILTARMPMNATPLMCGTERSYRVVEWSVGTTKVLPIVHTVDWDHRYRVVENLRALRRYGD